MRATPFTLAVVLTLTAPGAHASDAGTGSDDAGIAGWTCAPALFDDGTCDCACGIIDDDCGVFPDVSDCVRWDCPDGIVDGEDITRCRTFTAPEAWTCQEFLYESGGACDCGCGVVDADCAPPLVVESCDAIYCEPGFHVTDDDIGVCQRIAPEPWWCAAARYVDDVCDCGCGAPDPRCASADLEACEREHCDAPAHVDPDDTSACLYATLPDGWTCSTQSHGDLICDCGCGARDPDCPLPQDEHDCLSIACESEIVDESDPTQCGVLPEGWTCSPRVYDAEDRCNCACGAWDPDCDDPAVVFTSCAEGFVCARPGTCVEAPSAPDAGTAVVDAGDEPEPDPPSEPACRAVAVRTAGVPLASLALVALVVVRARRRAR